MCNERRPLNIGIVYSGGTSKCAYQVGFTKGLLKHIDYSEIKVVSGASMGVLSAYALSANKLSRLEWMYRDINIDKKRELFWETIFKGLFSKTLHEFVSLYDELEIPVCFPVCYVPLMKTQYYWLKGKFNPYWKRYIEEATNCPPLRIWPLINKCRLAFDGGAVDNIPIYPLLQHSSLFTGVKKLDLIIAIHFDSRYDPRTEFTDEVPILDIDISICNSFKKDHFDFSSKYVGDMIENAEAYADELGKFLFTGDCSYEGLKQKIDEIFLREHQPRQQHLSADRLVSGLNVLGKACRFNTDCYKKLY